MRKIIVLLIFLQGLAVFLFSQNITGTGYNSPFSVNTTDCIRAAAEERSDSLLRYDLGGHLFAGQYPINNPFNTGDTGIVYLYRVYNNSIIPTDTIRFSNLGYFVFVQILEGKYILKARLTQNSVHYKDYFPTYLTSSLKWNSSNFVELTDRNIFEANIHLVPTVDNLTGDASIKGYVVQVSIGQGLKIMSDAEVILFNDNMDPLTFCFSDSTGLFYFPDLAYGTYNLMAESAGRFPTFLRITLDQNHTSLDSVLLEALTQNPAAVEELGNPIRTEICPVFPNPAKDYINMVIRTSEPENLNVAIFSPYGQKIISGDYLITGVMSLKISVGLLSEGVYFLMVRTPGGQWKEVQKFVKL